MDENAKIKQLKSDLAGLLFQGKGFAEKSAAGTLTADESTQFDTLVTQINTCKTDLETETDRFAKATEVLKLNELYNRPDASRGKSF
jgi:hypothetical protein